MRYISLDIETTCVHPMKPENILMLSMVIEDTKTLLPVDELPHFTCYFVRKDDTYTGSAYALQMNAWIFEMLSGKKPFDRPAYEIDGPAFKNDVEDFFVKNGLGLGKKFLAGKNIAVFDYQFLPEWLKGQFKARMIDPGSVFLDFKSDGIKNLDDLKKEFGLMDGVSHNAYEDAKDVIRILRKKYE